MIKFTPLKCTNKNCLVNLPNCAIITQSTFRAFSSTNKILQSHSQSILVPISSPRQPPIHFLSLLDISYNQNHTICRFMCQSSLIQHNLFTCDDKLISLIGRGENWGFAKAKQNFCSEELNSSTLTNTMLFLLLQSMFLKIMFHFRESICLVFFVLFP